MFPMSAARRRSLALALSAMTLYLAAAASPVRGSLEEGVARAVGPVGEFVARGGALVVARGGDARGVTQRASAEQDARISVLASPVVAVPGAEVWVEVRVTNTGETAWSAGDADPVRLSYHWYEGAEPVVWDGVRTALGSGVAPGRSATVVAAVRVPDRAGFYTLAWDLVREGAGWFSGPEARARGTTVAVRADGVTLYGKGWGHGSGLSQWGAQGWALGAAGERLDGEQIALRYFPGATLGQQPPSSPFRVLLSSPSTGCVKRTIHDRARMWSAGGMRLVNDQQPDTVYAEVGPDAALDAYSIGGRLHVSADGGWSWVYIGDDAVTLVPTRWWDPIAIREKGLAYRGTIRLQAGQRGLSVVNYVSSDDYMQGVLPSEMPAWWEFEALRAQAITARTYAAWRQSEAQGRIWDVLDDIADQCYGGRSHESPRSTAAVQATKGQILVHQGKPIRALFSSAHGGMSENVGCTLDVARVAGRWSCEPDWPYTRPVEDPAELAAWDKFGPMPHVWTREFSSDLVRREIAIDYGIDIGQLITMQFAMSAGGRPVSVKVVGSLGVADLPGDRFLRHTLGLKSSLVRTAPF